MKHQGLILLLLFLVTSYIEAQEGIYANMKREWITEDIRSNFGNVTDLYEDSLGIIWMGIYGKGLAFYNGQEIRRVPLPEEVIFANQATMFYPFQTGS